ncbi:UbiA family prenyltransferase [Aspergillus brunneoviolaceus CBS 621.78]|uniref:Uncharacterized protein n=1 Tax=Aspergillus brunneoviolaceus CBS 621.78 TaxID=1450534 RepID=A0ACD1FS60_9EURO|nr:hypothetical protein BO95DRAFT_377057 [Aspergillus brunneoviolaceus CBS 621.78]RAH39838.1 hypothetical protein BO95DRAFT_377057 [Aspergillus brunneoviolaceus CBS 621.78]
MGASLSFRQILVSLPRMFLWSWSNLFLFTLHNQRSASAISEDRINKPWRPLSAGRITPHQAKMLIYCMYPAMFVISGTMGGVAPCLLEAFSCLWYNEWNGASNPLLKNLLNGIGFACFFAGPLEVATNSSVLSDDMKAFTWLLVLAGAITTTVHAQDFRDIDGDRATGRRTVPLLIGDENARSALAVGIIAWTALSCWFWDVGSAERSWLSCLPACVAGTIVVWGFYWSTTREGDRRSWQIYPLWLIAHWTLCYASAYFLSHFSVRQSRLPAKCVLVRLCKLCIGTDVLIGQCIANQIIQ